MFFKQAVLFEVLYHGLRLCYTRSNVKSEFFSKTGQKNVCSVKENKWFISTWKKSDVWNKYF